MTKPECIAVLQHQNGGVRQVSSPPAKLRTIPARFERATPGFGGQYSIQLSYGTNCDD